MNRLRQSVDLMIKKEDLDLIKTKVMFDLIQSFVVRKNECLINQNLEFESP